MMKIEWFDYFPKLTLEQKKQFEQLEAIYTFWNSKINVISRKDIQFLQIRHILHALAIAKVVHFLPQTKAIDLGTGGGIPGIPLAIMFPETQFYLVDRIKKKMKVVEDIVHQLNLKNVVCFVGNGEKIPYQAHYLVCRAVTKINQILTWMSDKITPLPVDFPVQNGGIYCLKGGEWKKKGALWQEFSSLKHPCRCYSISDFFNEEFFLTKKVIHIANK